MSHTWLITGASRGIGLELVRQLLAAGEAVIATARDPGSAASLTALASPALTIEKLDLEDRGSIDALAERLSGRPVDILFNNAGLYGGSWDDSSGRQGRDAMDYDLWEQIMCVNVMAPFRLTNALLPNLAAGNRKLVVMMSSDLGSITSNGTGQSHAYRSSKAALNMVTKGLSVELADAGMTLVAMAPGWTRTDLGGSNAQWAVEESVANQLAVINALTSADNGRFVNLLGETVPW